MNCHSPLTESDLTHVLVETSDLWNEVRNSSFFITGGTGFFGVWLLESLHFINRAIDLNLNVTVLSRDPQKFLSLYPHLARANEIKWIQGDIETFKFPIKRFDYLIQAATEPSARADPDQASRLFESIVSGMKRTLEFAHQAEVKKFLFTSSGAVYGSQPSDVPCIQEDYPGGPRISEPSAVYGEGKRVCELLGVLAAGRSKAMEFKIARCFAFVGPHLPVDGSYAIGNFIRDALRNSPISVAGDGTAIRSYLYSADLAIWLWTLLFKGRPNQPYNVGSSDHLSIAELAEKVHRLLGSPGVQIHKKPNYNSPVSRYVPDVTLAQRDLNLKSLINLDESILRTASWLRSFNH